MIEIDETPSGTGCRLIITPNCSISWHQLRAFYFLTCCLAVAIAIFFALQGQWMVVPFSGLEMLALGLALSMTSRKVHRREIITVDKERVSIEKGVRQVEQQWVFERCWIKLRDELNAGLSSRRKLALGSHGEYVEVGSFLSGLEKDALAFKLKDCIILA